MPGLCPGLPILFAQAAAAPPGKPEPNPFFQYLPLLPIPIIFYLLLIRPQQQQERQRRALMDNLTKGDKVLTASGMYGTVLSVDKEGDRVVLRLDDDGKVKVAFTRASIVRILGEPSGKPVEAK